MAAMDNFNRPAGGDPGDHQPTEQFWPGPGVPPGGPGPGHEYPWQQQPGLQSHLASDRRKARRWTVGIALAALLAGGGVIAGISLASTTLSAAPAASTGTGSGTAGSAGGGAAGQGGDAAPAGQAALLDATLNAAGSPGAAVTTSAAGATAPAAAGTGGPAATAPAVRRCAQLARTARAARLTGHPRLSGAARAATARCRFIRRRIVRFFLLRGVDGQFSFRAADGSVRTLAYVRGVIESVNNGTSIVVQAADGSSWAWQLVSTTVVRDGTGKISESSLAAGEQVWVGGPVVSGVKDARLIFVRPPSG
jgi:hypothetical protein